MTETFGTHPDGSPVLRVGISGHGLRADIMTHGASLLSFVPKGGRSVVLGHPDHAAYLTPEGMYFGAIVGRFANRIGGARATVGGRDCRLDANFRGRHLLHGGADGTGVRNWRIVDLAPDRVTLTDHLPDGHMGFPGALDVRVSYALEDHALRIGIEAMSDAETLCSFAQHSYFNLDGGPDIANHHLRIDATHYLPVDDDLIPTGEIASVDGTRFDFRQGAVLGDRLGRGMLDHNLCLDRRSGLRPVAWIAAGDRRLTVETTEPGLQLYAGAHVAHAGLALEPQRWPDSPHHPDFPGALLRPGETYRQVTRLVAG